MESPEERKLTLDEVTRVREFMKVDKLDKKPTSARHMARALNLPYRLVHRYCMVMEKGNPTLEINILMSLSPINHYLTISLSLVLSCLVLSCLVLSCLVLSCLGVLSFLGFPTPHHFS